jgi:hypothetical protein
VEIQRSGGGTVLVRRKDGRRRTSQQGKVAVISNPEQTAEIFFRTKILGRNVMAILDTGCEMSIISRRLMDSKPMEESNLKLYAANGTDIPLQGRWEMMPRSSI